MEAYPALDVCLAHPCVGHRFVVLSGARDKSISDSVTLVQIVLFHELERAFHKVNHLGKNRREHHIPERSFVLELCICGGRHFDC